MAWPKVKYQVVLKVLYPLAFGIGILLHLFRIELARLTTPFFLLLLPLPLLILEYKAGKVKLIRFFLIFALITFIIEVVGVKTGLIFGRYHYLDRLGIALFNVPLLIGILWSTLLFATYSVASHLKPNKIPRPYGRGILIHLHSAEAECPLAMLVDTLHPQAIAWGIKSRCNKLMATVTPLLVGLLMVLIDFFLEKFAIKSGYWSWDGVIVPFQNYLAWFIISYVGAVAWQSMLKSTPGLKQSESWRLIFYSLLPFLIIA